MKLQYVFANPSKKAQKSKKRLGTTRKTRKIKKGGTSVAKKKPSKAQLRARAAFVKRFAKGKKKSRKKGKNPVVTYRTLSKKKKYYFPGEGRVKKSNEKRLLAKEFHASALKEHKGMTPFEVAMEAKKLKKLYNSSKRALSKSEKKAEAVHKKYLAGLKRMKKIKDSGGVIDDIKPTKEDMMAANPKRKRKKRRSKRKSHKSKLRVSMNPKRKKRRKAKRKSKKRKSRAPLIHASGSARVSNRARKSFKRKKKVRLSVKVNPSVKEIVAVYGTAALGGAMYPWFNYGVNWLIAKVDQMVGGQVGSALSKVEAMAPGVTAPTISLVASLGVKELDKRFDLLKMLGGDTKKYVHQALDAISVLSAAGIGMALADKVGVSPAKMGLSGVRYFPHGLSGADFGYPQMGQYKQSHADFGGVKYFPEPMSGVEFFPEGSRGDEMYSSSEHDELAEAQGLGVIPEGLGVIPEGLGSADFGVIPEGLGYDEGQMG